MREAFLAVVVGCLVIALQPDWFSPVSRLTIVIVGLLAAGAVISRALVQVPVERVPTGGADNVPGEIRRMREIEQAREFLLAVHFQLAPFLQQALADIAAQRLLAHHNIELRREPGQARGILGEALWSVVEPRHGSGDHGRWTTITVDQLLEMTDALEAV